MYDSMESEMQQVSAAPSHVLPFSLVLPILIFGLWSPSTLILPSLSRAPSLIHISVHNPVIRVLSSNNSQCYRYKKYSLNSKQKPVLLTAIFFLGITQLFPFFILRSYCLSPQCSVHYCDRSIKHEKEWSPRLQVGLTGWRIRHCIPRALSLRSDLIKVRRGETTRHEENYKNRNLEFLEPLFLFWVRTKRQFRLSPYNGEGLGRRNSRGVKAR